MNASTQWTPGVGKNVFWKSSNSWFLTCLNSEWWSAYIKGLTAELASEENHWKSLWIKGIWYFLRKSEGKITENLCQKKGFDIFGNWRLTFLLSPKLVCQLRGRYQEFQNTIWFDLENTAVNDLTSNPENVEVELLWSWQLLMKREFLR